ncbi:IS110 family transposase, partial [Mycobacterium palustre]|nr:IS110 family transposase [Mycobacterium palustre]
MSIPGFSTIVADVFIAETGADMSVFPTAAHLASWAGVVPGCNESAGRVKSAATRAGNRYLKAALGVAALSAARSKDTYYNARYRRIAGSRPPQPKRRNRTKAQHSSPAGMIALVALEHKMLTDAYNMLPTTC